MKLQGKRAAILVEDIYNEFELWIPYYRLKEEGVEIVVVGSGTATTYHGKYGIPAAADKQASEVTAGRFRRHCHTRRLRSGQDAYSRGDGAIGQGHVHQRKSRGVDLPRAVGCWSARTCSKERRSLHTLQSRTTW
jgi:hypothetical protein